MKKAEIHVEIELDADNVPERIFWDATDNPNEGLNDTKALSLATWDRYHQSTMKLDLWTKDMEVGDMKQFYIEIMAGVADAVLSATGDEPMATKIHALCKELSQELRQERRQENKPS